SFQSLVPGLEMNVLTRSPQKITQQHNMLRIIQGDTTDLTDVTQAIEGCEAVVSALNISYKRENNPWSKLAGPPHLLSETMDTLLAASHTASVKRVVLCSALGVGDSWLLIPGWFRFLIKNSTIGIIYKDHDRQEQLLRESSIPNTIVRPVGLTNSNKPEKIQESFGSEIKLKLTISRASVARYMLDALGREDLIGKTPGIAAEG
ncbi:MAG: NAD(P)-binding oxidoreductase, partial [Bacteroidota bacterium]